MAVPECRQRREIDIPDCKEANPGDCRRAYHLYLPSIICGGDNEQRRLRRAEENGNEERPPGKAMSIESVGTLPLVFSVHCLGCTADSMTAFVEHANYHNAVLVIPEGLHGSFNAPPCCGYALKNEIDDVGFFKHIQTVLSEEYPFVQSDFSYATGWSNGGFMVVHAAELFRSISPISGYIGEIDPSLTKGGTFCVDGICVDAPGNGKGLFIHHGKDDTFVRPTGCCNDPDKPKCCCDIAADTCVAVEDITRNWALEVNGCEAAERRLVEEKQPGSDEERVDEAQDDKKEEEGGEEQADEEKEEHHSSVSGAKFVTSYSNSERGIECLTTTGTECKANTTICLHDNAGHFNRPSFTDAFPFAKEVIEFFARDACGINDGTWDKTSAVCTCPENRVGTFCLDDPIVEIVNPGADDDFYSDLGITPAKASQKVMFVYALVALAMFTFVRNRYKGGAKKDDRYFNDVIDEEMEEATELVSSRRSFFNQ